MKNFLIIFGYDFSNALNVQKLVGACGGGGGGAGETFKILKFSFLSLSFFFVIVLCARSHLLSVLVKFYGVRSPPKFIVSSFKFQPEFYSRI